MQQVLSTKHKVPSENNNKSPATVERSRCGVKWQKTRHLYRHDSISQNVVGKLQLKPNARP